MTWIFDTPASKRSLAVLWILGGSLLVGVAVGLVLALSGPSHGDDSPDGTPPASEAAAKPDPEEMTLRLNTVPEGAEIVGPRDEVLGITPLTLQGTPEELTGIYTAWADGFEPLQRKVSVDQLGDEPIVLELDTTEPVRCVVRTSPAGAVVTDSGVEIGETPTVVEVVPGSRRLIEISLAKQTVSLELKGIDDCMEYIEFSVAQTQPAVEDQATARRENGSRERRKPRKKRRREKERDSAESSGTWRVRPELAR